MTTRTAPYRCAAVDLTRFDCISAGSARTVLTVVGGDLSKFPNQ